MCFPSFMLISGLSVLYGMSVLYGKYMDPFLSTVTEIHVLFFDSLFC